MIVHFIGGPAHGRAEAMSDPQLVIKMPLSEPAAYFKPEDDASPLSGPMWKVAEYRITRRTDRYCIAEYEEPQVTVHSTVTLSVDEWDSVACYMFDRLVRDWHEGRDRFGVQFKSIWRARLTEVSVHLAVKVPGPPDNIALAVAADKVHAYIDATLPAALRTKVAVTAARSSVS